MTCQNLLGSKAAVKKRAREGGREEEEDEEEERKEKAAREAASLQKKKELAKKRAEKVAKNKGRGTRTKTGVSLLLSGENVKGTDISSGDCDQGT